MAFLVLFKLDSRVLSQSAHAELLELLYIHVSANLISRFERSLRMEVILRVLKNEISGITIVRVVHGGRAIAQRIHIVVDRCCVVLMLSY